MKKIILWTICCVALISLTLSLQATSAGEGASVGSSTEPTAEAALTPDQDVPGNVLVEELHLGALFLGDSCSCTTNSDCNSLCFDGGTCLSSGECACNTPTPPCGGTGPGGGGGDGGIHECYDNEDCSTQCFDGGTCMLDESGNFCACW